MVPMSHRSGTHVAVGSYRATRVGRRSLVALAGLIVAVTLVCGLGGVSTAAAADPSYAWATQGGGVGIDNARGVSVLADGSSIITGSFSGTATFGTTILISMTALSDTFTAKVNADGTYAWVTQGGGPGTDVANGVSVLADGSSIITGTFGGANADFGTTSLLNASAGSSDTFTAKVNADGTYAWANRGGGTGIDIANGVSVLADGSSIITGTYTLIAIFGTTPPLATSSSGSVDTFTAKVDADGGYEWAIRGGGTGIDIANGVSALADGSSIITGTYTGTPTFGTALASSAGSTDTFTAKVNADGTTYAWAIRSGGTGADYASGVSVLADGSSIITGYFDSATLIFGGATLLSAGVADTFTAKVAADGTTYVWANRGGGTGIDVANGVSALADGSSIITGSFNGIATFGTTSLTSVNGLSDTFTAKVDADGTYAWATRGGGPGTDVANGVSALADGSSIITGTFTGTPAIFGTTPPLTSTAGSVDIFTARIVIAPHAPTGVGASSGIREAIITWNAVTDGLVTSYTATASPGGASCTAVAPTVTCTITNLTAGTSYTATVTATNQQGTSPASQASNAVTPTAPVNIFTMKLLKRSATSITTQLNLPGPGNVVQVGTKKAGTMIVCRARKTVAKAGKVTIICRLTAKARAARKQHALKVRLVTTFTPTGGTAKSVSRTLVLKKTR